MPNTANTLSHLRLSIVVLRKYILARHQVLQKHLIRCFYKTWLQLVLLRSAIREIQRCGIVLAAKNVTKRDKTDLFIDGP